MRFELPDDLLDLGRRVRAFVRAEVLPLEPLDGEDGLPDDVLAAVRVKARAAGLFTPQLPTEHGGLGLPTLGLCAVFEEAGYSPCGALALHCAAPDEGNMHLLLKAATAGQRERYFRPLARGATRSCFAMTEPAPGAGSDPTMMRTVARQHGAGWMIDGHKWFTTGARGAVFAIVAARTDPDLHAKQAVTLFLVDADTPGYQVVRDIPTMTSGTPGGHCEVRLTNCFVPDSQILGRVGEGFKLMQQRLGPARLTHCMRWLGAARRAMDIAVAYAKERRAFGKALSEHQATAFAIADCSIELQAGRLMTLHAAAKLDSGDEARTETSACKVFVAEAVGRVIDRCLQACGALGVSCDTLLERLYRDVRAFRIYDGPSEVHRMVVARGLFAGGGHG